MDEMAVCARSALEESDSRDLSDCLSTCGGEGAGSVWDGRIGAFCRPYWGTGNRQSHLMMKSCL